MHISIYAFLTHKVKILLLWVTCVRKRNHNGVKHLYDKVQLLQKACNVLFPSTQYNQRKDSFFVNSSQPYPANALPEQPLGRIFFSTDHVPITCSDVVLGFPMLPHLDHSCFQHTVFPSQEWLSDGRGYPFCLKVKPLYQPKDRILGTRGSQALSCFYNDLLTLTMNKIGQTFSEVSSSSQ